MTRRRYPIMGRLKLRLFDASITPSKPVYLRLSDSQSRSQDQSQDQSQDLRFMAWTSDSWPGPQIHGLVLNNILYLRLNRFIRPFDWVYPQYSSNKPQTGHGWYPVYPSPLPTHCLTPGTPLPTAGWCYVCRSAVVSWE